MNPLLLNFFLIDLFPIMDDIDIASDTDDDTTYMSAGNIDEATDSLG